MDTKTIARRVLARYKVASVEPHIKAVREAISDLKTLDRFTPFSQWYKGDHGKARTAVIKALKALIADVKTSKEPRDVELREAALETLKGIQSKSGGDVSFLSWLDKNKYAAVQRTPFSPESFLKKYATTRLASLAHTSAVQLKKDPTSCAVLGKMVLEEMNGGPESRALNGLLGKYKVASEVERSLMPVASDIAKGLQWDILAGCAFVWEILKSAKVPEAGKVPQALGTVLQEWANS